MSIKSGIGCNINVHRSMESACHQWASCRVVYRAMLLAMTCRMLLVLLESGNSLKHETARVITWSVGHAWLPHTLVACELSIPLAGPHVRAAGRGQKTDETSACVAHLRVGR